MEDSADFTCMMQQAQVMQRLRMMAMVVSSLPALQVKFCCKMSVSVWLQRNRRWRRGTSLYATAIALDRSKSETAGLGHVVEVEFFSMSEAKADLIRGCII